MNEYKEFLEYHVQRFNNLSFIQYDPISIPHLFVKKEDIEIAGLLTALISWGNRTAILKSGRQLMKVMNHSPFDFVVHADKKDLKTVSHFYYRTLNGDDMLFLVTALQNIYRNKGGMETIAQKGYDSNKNIKDVIIHIREAFLETPHLNRSEKHLANPDKGSAAKRLNMFLRWMIRKDEKGVDFGLWKNIPDSGLMCPLDVHSGRIARQLKLLTRKQNDWQAVEELTAYLRKFDANDPVKYDFALFGIGMSKPSTQAIGNSDFTT